MDACMRAWIGEWTLNGSIIDEGEKIYRINVGHAESEVSEWSPDSAGGRRSQSRGKDQGWEAKALQQQ